MFHATSARLARLVQFFRDQSLDRQRQIAAVRGWQVERVRFGTYRYRDPRFDTLRDRHDPRSPVRAGGDRDD